ASEDIGNRTPRFAGDAVEPSKLPVDLIGAPPEWWARCVQLADVGVEPGAGLEKPLEIVARVAYTLRTQPLAAPQFVEDGFFVRLVAMQLQAEITQPALVEPALDHLQRRRLFADEEDRFVCCQELGDDVGNRLALARAGGAVKHQVGSA